MKKGGTYSNTLFGTWSHDDRFARTGNRAPEQEPTKITKIAATRRLKSESEPPPEPQMRSLESMFGTGKKGDGEGEKKRCVI